MKSESERDVSFDPRSWVGPEAGGTGVPSPPRPAPLPPRRPSDERSRWAIAAAATFIILLVGAGLAWSQRVTPSAPAGTLQAARPGTAG